MVHLVWCEGENEIYYRRRILILLSHTRQTHKFGKNVQKRTFRLFVECPLFELPKCYVTLMVIDCNQSAPNCKYIATPINIDISIEMCLKATCIRINISVRFETHIRMKLNENDLNSQ